MSSPHLVAIENIGAFILEHSPTILLAIAVYITLRWLSSAFRAWLLVVVIISVLVAMFLHEHRADISEPSIEEFVRDAEVAKVANAVPI